jgi:bifunctional N-acetylglucosamine-1-phosphate-uridyltransferase/glucosamine-1-phosphate-acetyltransferase GlmU-like protein
MEHFLTINTNFLSKHLKHLTPCVGATVGAGSIITKDVGAAELAIARSKQRNIEGWERPVKKK